MRAQEREIMTSGATADNVGLAAADDDEDEDEEEDEEDRTSCEIWDSSVTI
jgi:hypothetical protein